MIDWELLQSWIDNGSEQDFAEIVQRHLNLVYHSALRQLRDPELAKDVSQAVFLALAQKARRLKPGFILSGWLFRTTCYISARAARSEARREHWGTEASLMNPLSSRSERAWGMG
jgi:DNA-directed RNA polymerase specialized sigma24 family protein